MPEPTFVLAFFRRNAVRPLKRVLAMAVTILMVGCVIVALSFLTPQSQGHRIAAALVGLSCTITGALTAIIGMHFLLRDETYIAAKLDGLLLSKRGEEHFIAWDDLRAVRYDKRREALVLECTSAGQIEFVDASIEADEMVRTIDQLRRRAQMGLRL